MENLSVWEQSGVIIIAGLLIVFIGLILLILVIWVMGLVVGALNRPKSGPPSSTGTSGSSSSAGASRPSSGGSSAVKRAETLAPGAVSGEIVAVITAAIAAMSGGSGFSIKSISRVTRPAGRSAWASAGVLENTRPF